MAPRRYGNSLMPLLVSTAGGGGGGGGGGRREGTLLVRTVDGRVTFGGYK